MSHWIIRNEGLWNLKKTWICRSFLKEGGGHCLLRFVTLSVFFGRSPLSGPKNEDNPKNEDSLKCEYDLKYEDNLKHEDDLKNKDNLNKEYNLKN